MKILALDATNTVASVALSADRELVGLEVGETGVVGDTQNMHLMVDRILRCHGWQLDDLTGIAFARGPGSFTGTRIVASIVQGLAYGSDLPVMPISSLRALALCALRTLPAVATATKNTTGTTTARKKPVAVCCTDAHRGEVSVGVYSMSADGDVRACADGEERLMAPGDMETMLHRCLPDDALLLAVGNGWKVARESAGASAMPGWDASDERVPPLAAEVSHLASLQAETSWLDAEHAQPVYLRTEKAWKTVAEQAAGGRDKPASR